MKKVSYIELSSILLTIIITFNSGITINILKNNVGIDSWLALIISYIIGIIPILLTIYISNYKPKLNIYEKNIHLFGKIFGNIINIIISIILFIIAITLLNNTINFINIEYLYHTPLLLSSIIFILVVLYCISKGPNVILHISLILLSFNILIYILTYISMMGEIKLDYLTPIAITKFGKIFIYGIKLAIINTLPVIAILIVPKDKITNKEKYHKSLLIAYLIGLIISLFTIVSTLGILGIHLTKIFVYPEYIALKKVKLLFFLERSENIISISWITESFIYLTMIIYTISKSITNKYTKHISIIIGLLCIIMSNYLFKNRTYFNTFINTKFIYIISILFIIYIIIVIKIFINNKKD